MNLKTNQLSMKILFVIVGFILYGSVCFSQTSLLDEEFRNPPENVRTSVFWYWMCGNISKEGVVKDLQEMKRVGINRAFIGNNFIDPNEGGREVKLMSEEWWDILHTALKTASELGIEVGIFNSPGWTTAGGPWVKPDQSMRYLTSSETLVKGPGKVIVQLEKPVEEFQDVKVIAYPAPKEKLSVLDSSNSKIEVRPFLAGQEKMFDGHKEEGIPLPKDTEIVVDFRVKDSFTARSLTVYPTHSFIKAAFELQAKIGDRYRTISKFDIHWYKLDIENGFLPFAPMAMTVEETTATEFRLLMKNSQNVGGIAEIQLSESPLIENYAAKTMAKMYQGPMPPWDYYMWRIQPEVKDKALNVDPERVLDISRYMTSTGKLVWDAPEGKWIVLRTGMTPTGRTNFPGGPDGTGLEIDKMSKENLAKHFNAFIGQILTRIPAQDRQTFKVVVQDSYEAGAQNFTDDFLEVFKKQYDYDPLPYLPTYFGKVVGTKMESDRFLWDMRRLVADRIAYDYVGGFRELCHKEGLRTWLENYGHWGFPSEFLLYGGQSDEVAGEYWLPNAYPSWENSLGNIENRAASSCAHIYGKKLVSAESNTCGRPAYSTVPADAKQRTDKYFSEGVNNTLLHVFIQQPDTNKYPGVNAWFGTEFNRSNTWYSHIDLFIDYIKRCNYMLRQGINIADVAYYIGEDTPKMTGAQNPLLPMGYQFDYINAEVLLRDVVVKDGLLMLPHGTTYRVLVLPDQETMRPEVLAKIKQLVKEGAVIVGPRPIYSPSLQGQPQADRRVKKMASELWKGIDGTKNTFAKYGKGLVFDGVGLEEVLSAISCPKDCEIPEGLPLLFGHRKMDDTDIYFITNQSDSMQQTAIKFRVTKKVPELFNPITGETRILTRFVSDAVGTTVPLTLYGHESCFVVFRKNGMPMNGIKNFSTPIKIATLDGPWFVSFQSKLSNPSPIKVNALFDLATSSNDSIRYFSGNMIYESAFDFGAVPSGGEKIYLHLGEIHDMAKVWINGTYMGGAWTMPYRVEISSALKQGKNTIRIDVVNTWVNRLIGDLRLPKEKRETKIGVYPYRPDSPLQKTGLVGPVFLESETYK